MPNDSSSSSFRNYASTYVPPSASTGVTTIKGSPWTVYGISEKKWNTRVPDMQDAQSYVDQMGQPKGEHSGANARKPFMTVGDVIQYIHQGGKSGVEDIQAQLFMTGRYGRSKPSSIQFGVLDKKTINALVKVFDENNMNQPAGKRQTWQEFLWSQATDQGNTGSSRRSGSGSSGPRTVTSKSVNLSNTDQSHAYLQSAMTDLLGRAPDPDQVKRFQSYLNGQEKAHPNVTTTHYDGSGSSTSSTSQGGVEGSVQAQNYLDQPQYAQEHDQYQIGQYMNAFANLLGGNTG